MSTEKAQLEIKNVKISELKENPKNPRIHPDSLLNKLVKSIKEYGWTNPVLASKDGYILAGHARCKAAVKAGIEEVPVIFLDLEGAKAEAYMIVDNRIQEESEWDLPKLGALLEDLKKDGAFDIDLTGFDTAEVEEILSKLHDKDVKEDDFDIDSALAEPSVSRQGDLWLLGRHRLICGDSTLPETYKTLMDGKLANLVVTDPPYNVNYGQKAEMLDEYLGGERNTNRIINDNMSDEDFYKFLLAFYKCVYEVMAKDASIYVFHADTERVNFTKAFRDAGFHLSGVCIWNKNTFVPGRSVYQWKHEAILYGWPKVGKHRWYGGRDQNTIWDFDKPRKNDLHPTMKPVGLCAYPIKNSTLTNCIVLDPFGGSGSTLIACEQTDRICFMVELDPGYVDVIVKRYIDYTGSSEGVFLLRNNKRITYEEANINDV